MSIIAPTIPGEKKKKKKKKEKKKEKGTGGNEVVATATRAESQRQSVHPAFKPRPTYMRRRRPRRPVPNAVAVNVIVVLFAIRSASCRADLGRQHRFRRRREMRRRAGAIDGPINPGLDKLTHRERAIDA